MGLLSDIKALSSLSESFLKPSAEVGIRSPWAGDLTRLIVTSDILSLYDETIEANCITRSQAMSIPGVYRARAILLSLIADKPLQAWARSGLAPVQASFLHRTPGLLGPWQRMARTLDDLIFYPYSLWLTVRGDVKEGRRDILNAVHCPYDSWRINEAGLIELCNDDNGWDVADDSECILIPGPSEGLIAYASRTLRGSADLESAWVDRAQTPAPLTELHITDDVSLLDEEIELVRDDWVKARRAGNAVAVTPSNIEVIDHGQADAQLFIEGRNASRLDIAAFFNLPGALLDATTATASLTYVTQEGTRSDVSALSLPYWTRPIEARLSQDDIVPAGQSVRFDFSSFGQTGITTED